MKVLCQASLRLHTLLSTSVKESEIEESSFHGFNGGFVGHVVCGSAHHFDLTTKNGSEDTCFSHPTISHKQSINAFGMIRHVQFHDWLFLLQQKNKK